jgi:hypothetical protein
VGRKPFELSEGLRRRVAERCARRSPGRDDRAQATVVGGARKLVAVRCELPGRRLDSERRPVALQGIKRGIRGRHGGPAYLPSWG